MRRRFTFGLGAALLVLGLFFWLRGPAQPRCQEIEKGMDWAKVEEIMGRQPYETYLSPEQGLLRKSFRDVDGKAQVVFDEEGAVIDVKYIPNIPHPGFFDKVAKRLRL
jgi:hypothetical protein